jgi:2-polyprenyl-3-methyl-5-hydroxy-6-metoxy-1,4-benzoquinol methylase
MKSNRCPVCAGEKNELDDQKLFVFRCSDCTHLFTVIPPILQDSYSEDYYTEKHRQWFENPDLALFARIVADLDVSNDPGKSLLDVGCGKGDFLRFARGEMPMIRLVGIDTALNADQGIQYIVANFDEYDFGDERFDYIVSTMVIEHVQDPCAFLQKIKSLLRPGGVMMIDTIHSGAFFHAIARALRAVGIRVVFDRLYDHHHLQHFNNRSLKRLVKDAGFTLLSHRNHNFPRNAVDVPKHGPVMEAFYRVAVACIFAWTNVFGGELCQSIICRKV